MIKGIIFDFDGVLIDSEHLNIMAGTQAFKEQGYDLSDDDKKLIPGQHSEDVVSRIVTLRNLNVPQEVLVARYGEIYNGLWGDSVTVMPYAKEVLEKLASAGVALGIATNNRRSRVEWFTQKLALGNIFSTIVSGDDVEKRKPDPEVYIRAKDKLQIPGPSLLAVEDGIVGFSAAKGAGLRCAIVYNQYSIGQKFPDADFTFRSLQNFMNHLIEEKLLDKTS